MNATRSPFRLLIRRAVTRFGHAPISSCAGGLAATLCTSFCLLTAGEGLGQGCPAFLPGTQVGTVTDSSLVEISGVAASRQSPGVLWVHNDSGDSARVFAINTQGDLLGTYDLGGAGATDYEDIAIGPVSGQDYLYVGDTGDNTRVRGSVTVYRVPEPEVAPDQEPVEVILGGVDALPMVYPSVAFDCETLLVDPVTKDLYLVTRDRGNLDGGVSFVFRNPAPHTAGVTVTLGQVASIPAPDEIKGGDISPSGDRILLRPGVKNQLVDALLWMWGDGMDIADVFAETPCDVPAVAEPQGEAIAFSGDGTSYYTISEGSGQPIYLYGPQTPETLVFAESESNIDGTVMGSLLDTYSSDDIYEEITERTRGGNPAKRRSQAEHKWILQLPPGDQVTLFVEAHHTPNAEGDDFGLSYSSDDISYTEFLTITKTADDDMAQSADLPAALSGTVYIRARDLDRSSGNGVPDTLFVDQLYVRVLAGDPVPPGPASDPSPADGTVGVAVFTDLVWTPGAGATSHAVYFGNSNPPPLVGNQTANTFSPGLLLPNTTYYWRIDEANSAGSTAGDVWSFTTGDAPVAVDDFADGESLATGTQIGSFLDTYDSDNGYEVLTEARTGRSSKNQRSALQHTWTISVFGGSGVTFFVEAHHSDNTEGDDFVFYYSLDNENFTEMLTVVKTSDDDTLQSFELPGTVSGPVYIQVRDADNSRGNSAEDSLWVDQLYIRSE